MTAESTLSMAIGEKLQVHVDRVVQGDADDLDYLPAVFHELLSSDKKVYGEMQRLRGDLEQKMDALIALSATSEKEQQRATEVLAEVVRRETRNSLWLLGVIGIVNFGLIVVLVFTHVR